MILLVFLFGYGRHLFKCFFYGLSGLKSECLLIFFNSKGSLLFKGMLWPILCIDINTHSDRKWKIV